jgi:hypothetical protein
MHGCGAKNTASIHTKSFQGFDGIRKEKERASLTVHVLSFNIMGFADDALVERTCLGNSEPYKIGGPHLRDKESHYTLVAIILSM